MDEYPKIVEVDGKFVKILDRKTRLKEKQLEKLQKDKPKKRPNKNKRSRTK